MTRSRKKAETATYSRADLAAMLGVTAGTFDRVWRPLVPEKHIVRSGSRTRYKATAVRAIVDAKEGQARSSAAPSARPAEIPVLNPLQEIKVEEARINLLQKTGRLISIDEAFEIFSQVAEHLRLGLATLEQKYGPDACKLMEQQLDRAGRTVEAKIAQRDTLQA